MRKIRLFIDKKPLKCGILAEIDGQDFVYLAKVMRVKIDEKICIFNGFDGEFSGRITAISKKNLTVLLEEKICDQDESSFVTLAFAPVKNVRIDFVATKATEMGVAKFQPMITQRTIVDKINEERFKANIKEACEQCETNFIPEILPMTKLDKLLEKASSEGTIIILCDESGNGQKASEILPKIAKNRNQNQEVIIFIGPEGGFSPQEFERFYKISNLCKLSLGKRILRADTAIISALALVGEFF